MTTSDAVLLQRKRLGRSKIAWDAVCAAVGKRYEGVSLDTFDVATDAQRKVIETLRKFVANIGQRTESGEGLLLIGPKGTGKDHLAIACLREAAKSGFVTLAEFGESLFQRFRDGIGTEATERDCVKRFTEPDVLLLSDPVPASGTLTDHQRSVLLRIVDRRYRDLKATWATLNVTSGEEAETRMGGQIVDRLRDGATVVKCEWASYRKSSA